MSARGVKEANSIFEAMDRNLKEMEDLKAQLQVKMAHHQRIAAACASVLGGQEPLPNVIDEDGA